MSIKLFEPMPGSTVALRGIYEVGAAQQKH